MFYLHVSNRTENLLAHLLEVFRLEKRRNLFEKELFLIQSQGMERLISQALALKFRSWCNFEYHLPLSFLQFSARKLGIEITPDGYERSVMVWRVEELLREVNGDDYLQVRQYLQGENVALKRYQLAEQLANVFDQYQMMRPEMLAAWEKNLLITGEKAESWQKDLWRRLSLQGAGAFHRGRV
jgi:exodeoxyribonuclease V gamma subunit